MIHEMRNLDKFPPEYQDMLRKYYEELMNQNPNR
jgi:hypothetical protein